ncbi:Uncharacterised protein [Acinetobacter baumannii]|nr:Uncharacterised protein [Acinetobacter baumannii]SVM57465.1 Uncharacterised protein [Acinetobacter baumannii]
MSGFTYILSPGRKVGAIEYPTTFKAYPFFPHLLFGGKYSSISVSFKTVSIGVNEPAATQEITGTLRPSKPTLSDKSILLSNLVPWSK